MKDYSNYYNKYVHKEYKLKQAQTLFNKQLEHEGQTIKLQGTNIEAIVRNHGNPTNEYKEERYVITNKNINIEKGNIVNYLNEDYLINTDIDRDNPIYNTCKMRKSTLQLSFLNSKGDICTYPVIEESATKYSDGISDNGKTKLADNQRVMLIPLTDDTRDFKVGKRFLFDKTHAFEITFDGLNKENSLKEIMLTQTQIHEDVDNLDLLIADYYGHAHEYTMEILNTNIEMNTNNQCLLQINVYDKGIKVDNPLIEHTIADNTIIKVEKNTITSLKEGTTHITVKFKDIIQTVNVNIKNVPINGNYTCEIIGEDTIALGTSEVYEYKLYANGNEVKLPLVWTLTDENNKPTTYGMLNNLIDNKCTINIYDKWIFNDGYKKYVYLHCKSEKCNEIIKQIKITQF